jgi:ATP-dependent Lon protease
VKSGLEIVPVSRMDEVLAHALTSKPEAIEWDEEAEGSSVPVGKGAEDDDSSGVVAH